LPSKFSGIFVHYVLEKTREHLFVRSSIINFGKKKGKLTVTVKRYKIPKGSKEFFKDLKNFLKKVSPLSKSSNSSRVTGIPTISLFKWNSLRELIGSLIENGMHVKIDLIVSPFS